MTKVVTSDSGTAMAIRAVVRSLRRKTNMKKTASPPPRMPERLSSLRPLVTSSELSRK